MKLSIVIPVFNEEKTIGRVIDVINTIRIPSVTKEIIIVDDGSTDMTKKEIEKAKKKHRAIQFLSHKTNQGKGTAIVTGLKAATGEYIVIQDADMEYHPQDIQKLLAEIKNKKHAVYGTRLKRFPHFSEEERRPRFLIQYMGNKFLSLITSILYGQWITDMETGYKLFPKAAVKNMRLHAKRFDFEPEITVKLLKNGFSIIEVPITTNPRGFEEGKKLQPFKDGPIALWTLIKYRFVD